MSCGITAVGDVARQKQAVADAQLIAAIVEYSDDAIIGSTLNCIITSWNPAAERMYGYSSEEIIGKCGSLLAPDDRADEFLATVSMVKEGKAVKHFGTTRVRKDGSVVPVSLTVAPIRDEDGAIVGVSAVHRDVSEQRRAFELAQRMKAIVESSDDAIIDKTLEGIITSWNPAAQRMYGYSSEEIVGRSIDRLIPEAHIAEMAAIVAKVRAGQHVEHLETIRVRKDGTVFPVSITSSPIRDQDGAIVGASAVHRDVSEQRRAFEVAQRMKAIVESSDDAIIGRTLEGIITSWNPAAERMYGYSSEEVVGKSIDRLIPEAQMAEIGAIVAKIRAGQPVERLETVRVRKDGTVFPVSITISPIRDEDGAIVGASAVHRDVSEQRRAFELAQRIKAIVESSDDAIISITLEAIVTSWNPAAERMYGYSSQEIVGTSIDRLYPEDRVAEMGAILAKVRAGEQVEHLETVRVRKDGAMFPVSLTISPIRDEYGAIVGASAVVRNLTELQHAARYARSLIEAALDPLATISPAGKITDVNEASVKVTGVHREALIGSDFSQYFTDPDMAREGYASAFARGSLLDYPLTLVHQDGTLIDVLCNASVYRDVNGTVLGVLAVARDASKLRQQQQLSEQLQEALESRIVIEQAKGITAQRHGVTIDQAYQRIRMHARSNHASLRTVAQAIVEVGLQV
jgi:PAS domain S-box-containing protein